MDIKEIIVVEGKADTCRLKEVFPGINTIETRGSAIDKKTLDLIAEAQRKCGVIIFTDPDYQGEKIRKIINNYVDNCKNAYMKKEKAIDFQKHKVGIEHCNKEDIIEALACITKINRNESNIQYQDLMELKLIGNKDSQRLREYISDTLHLGYNNAKQFYKKIKKFNITKGTLEELIKEYNTVR